MRTIVLSCLLQIVFLYTSFAQNTKAHEPLNIIFILADDWGWTDWQMNGRNEGSAFYETPNLDKLASQGTFFSQAYAHPLCSPSRAAFLTGKYPGARLHMHAAITGASTSYPVLPGSAGADTKTCFPESKNHLPLEEITIAEELKSAGYKTFQFGKWHLGNPDFYPTKQGFDHEFAVGGAGPGRGGYFAPYNGLGSLPQGPEGEYITERITDEVCKTIENVKDEKFFIYFAHFNVHSPYEAKADVVEKYRQKLAKGSLGKHKNPVMAAMIEALDESVGKVMNKLEELGIEGNTMVVVMGDNGGVHWTNDKNNPDIPVTSNEPLRAGKCCFYEGGVRVPLLIKYPGKETAGTTENTPVHIIDFYPTFCNIAGIEISKEKDVCDGKSIMPLLTNNGVLEKRPLFCHFPRKKQIGADVGGSYIREGDYKLYRLYGLNEDATDAYELYNVCSDLGETRDSIGYLPEIATNLKSKLANWLNETGALIPVPNPHYIRPE
ncbi:sulfatase [Draconibacterium sp.]|uniref:sulfatase n=1 Tax=Draconibacterium sp. TaxID=1965318 RepID=UPI0035626D9D